MAVITLAEYKAIRGISGTTQDAQITALIPIVQDEIIQFCNQDWGAGTVDEAFPVGLKSVSANMITYQMSGAQAGGKKSESIDGYSYTKDDVGDSGYPVGIEKGLSRYRVASIKYGQIQTQFREKRKMGLKNLANGQIDYYVPGLPIEVVEADDE
jgi:hypothetical protein